ncbi:MAG TPA: carboxypeptidase-like regulatory domain-containing protein [Bryobacteraceae bacterium]|nr:carboxypeptidase-like regulatory domain-containing protein [Bryobacteraceae bacterium]
MLAKSVRMVAILAVVAVVGAPASGQKKSREERREEANSRSAMGVVTGADDMPAAGAVVQLKDMRTLQIRSFITQSDGTYHFYNLKADVDYQLTARSGDATAAPRTLSVFDTRKEAILNFKLENKK